MRKYRGGKENARVRKMMEINGFLVWILLLYWFPVLRNQDLLAILAIGHVQQRVPELNQGILGSLKAGNVQVGIIQIVETVVRAET